MDILAKKGKFTIKQFNKKYPNDDACLEYIFNNKFGSQTHCTECNNKFNYYKISDRKCYSCAFCSKHIYPLANTIFHRSPTSLRSWFYAIFLFSTSKNGVSAKELERQLGVTYKCAYRIAQQIRKLFDENIEPLKNDVEIDETYIGGKESNKHKDKKTENTQGRSLATKTAVLGAVQRQGNVIAKVVSNTKSSTIQPFVRENIQISSSINTDEYRSYNNIKKWGYSHSLVEHGKKQWKNGESHTNTIEGFWSQLKRSINGTYHFVSPKHLQQYVNEFTYRYNLRNSTTPIFSHIMKGLIKWTKTNT